MKYLQGQSCERGVADALRDDGEGGCDTGDHVADDPLGLVVGGPAQARQRGEPERAAGQGAATTLQDGGGQLGLGLFGRRLGLHLLRLLGHVNDGVATCNEEGEGNVEKLDQFARKCYLLSQL